MFLILVPVTIICAIFAVKVININLIYLLTRNMNVESNQNLVVIYALGNSPINHI